MEAARHAIVVKELFQYRMRICRQRFWQNALARTDLAVAIDINIMTTVSERSALRILPALFIQILQNGTTVGGRITVFAIPHTMTHRPAHVIHHAGSYRFNAGIHRHVVQRHAAPATNTEQPDTVAIYLFLQP